MNITHILLKETIPSDDSAFSERVRAAKERMVSALLHRLIANPLLFTITHDDSGTITIEISVNVIAPDDMLLYDKRLQQAKQLVAGL